MQEKINKRILIVEDQMTNLYIVESLKSQFDEVLIISDYMKPISELTDEERLRLPVNVYNPLVSPDSPKPLKIRTFNKVPYAKMKDIDLGENNAFFVVGKLSWYFIRDLQTCHIGLLISPAN